MSAEVGDRITCALCGKEAVVRTRAVRQVMDHVQLVLLLDCAHTLVRQNILDSDRR